MAILPQVGFSASPRFLLQFLEPRFHFLPFAIISSDSSRSFFNSVTSSVKIHHDLPIPRRSIGRLSAVLCGDRRSSVQLTCSFHSNRISSPRSCTIFFYFSCLITSFRALPWSVFLTHVLQKYFSVTNDLLCMPLFFGHYSASCVATIRILKHEIRLSICTVIEWQDRLH